MMEQLQNRRDEIAQEYFDALPFEPYPVQEEALFAWFSSEQGVLMCAPTGTGKTLVAEAAIYEALKLRKTAYYTTPLIALTDQKFQELQRKAVAWGFSASDIGLVTGNRKINPQAKILVVVAEILLNRLLHREAFDFGDVWAVVMDEFHSFNDRDRGIVWEFGLSLLPSSVRTLLLSATVGNASEFCSWLRARHQRGLDLVQGTERKVPLTYQWVEDQLLSEQLESMVGGVAEARLTPALLFCFNREQCWTIAEQLKGKKVVTPDQQKAIAGRLDQSDWSKGAGPKLKQILMRGVGVHHAGILPRYRRIVEQLFQDKLLSVCVCTETLAAGINLPARSVLLPTLLKGPPRKKKVIEPSAAHQMFGRAGRPQFDDRGFVIALAHEDDVKLLRWREKYEQIPEDTKDPGLRKAKKALKKKMPKRNSEVQYWSQQQFEQLKVAPPADLASRGPLPWRMLVYMLDLSPEVEPIRRLIDGRLLDSRGRERAHRELNRRLITLWRGGYVSLEPKPPLAEMSAKPDDKPKPASEPSTHTEPAERVEQPAAPTLDLGQRASEPTDQGTEMKDPVASRSKRAAAAMAPSADPLSDYRPVFAYPTETMEGLLNLRGVHPLYGLFLMNHLGIADRTERIQAMESLLELPRSLGKAIRIPPLDEMPSGPLAATRLDAQLLKLGLATSEELGAVDPDEEDERGWFDEERAFVLTLPHKLQRLFQYDFPGVDDLRVWPAWVAGAVLEFGGDFNKYITSYKLQKQEGMVFRHLLRMVLLIDEFATLCPPDIEPAIWREEIGQIADDLEDICRVVDSESTEKWLENARKTELNPS
ncbi:MAG: DEAD/DEAH box helicase [Mariniblastus sp.]|nr:DEAD/DEAH box helicase [Mariniblastus sp.]